MEPGEAKQKHLIGFAVPLESYKLGAAKMWNGPVLYNGHGTMDGVSETLI